MAHLAKVVENAGVSSVEAQAFSESEVVRCEHCKLVQFLSASQVCRRCKHALPAPTRGTLFLVSRAFSFDLSSVEDGFPLEALNHFAETSGLPLSEIYEVVIPARTLKHRRSRHESLSRDESDKLARLMRVHDQAMSVFADKERALWWLRQRNDLFEGRTPLQMARTESGGRLVEEALVQIDEGMYV